MTLDSRTATRPLWRRGRSNLAELKDENSRLLAEDTAAGSVVFRGLPEVITFNHSDICNLRCVMCPRHLAPGTNRLERPAITHIVNELFPTARKVVLTTAGGEPLAVDFDLLLDSALRYEVKVDVVTNGVLLDRELYRRARGALDHLNVSLDSHIPEVYEKIRLGARYAQVAANLETIREERAAHPDDVLYSISAVVMRSNLAHLPEFLRHAARLGIDAVVFQRLRHDVKPTPDEDPYRAPGAQVVNEILDECASVANELGLNLSMTDHGRPMIINRPIRNLVPSLRAGHGCWFILQNFNVLYTGDVFPCCEPTDLHLGNVLYEDPADIWNGGPFQQLRRDHVTRRGNVFCSGCIHASELRDVSKGLLGSLRRDARWRLRAATGWLRARRQRRRTRIYDPPIPEHRVMAAEFGAASTPARAQAAGFDCEAAAACMRTQSVVFLRDGALMRSAGGTGEPAEVLRVHPAGAPPGAAIAALSSGALLASFEGQGVLLRIEGGRVTPVLRLQDQRSFVRQSTIAVGADGQVWVGEYGVFPGARCAHLYASRDEGRTFQHVAHFQPARHMHLVQCLSDGRVLVTTGDLLGEQSLFTVERGRIRKIQGSWAGFTAAVETADLLVCGTDLAEHNGLALFAKSLAGPPAFVPFPPNLDLQVRSIIRDAGGDLLALCSMDADLAAKRAGKRAVLLRSAGSLAKWDIVHAFEPDWSDAPEFLIQLPWANAGITTMSSGGGHPRSRSMRVEW